MTKKKKITIFILAVILLFFLWFLYWFFFTDRTTPTQETGLVTPTTNQFPTPLEEKGRGDPNLYEKLQIETQNKYPLLNLTPHRESNWTLDYIGPLRFEVTVKGTLTEAIKTEVLNWITNQGIDPNTHQIDWKSSR